MPLRSERALLAGLSLYAILILGSQATMSIGIGILLAFAFYAFGGPLPFLKYLREQSKNPELRRYLLATNLLTLACFLSLFFAWLFPVELAGEKPKVRFLADMWKAWYFYWPLVTVPCLLALTEKSRKTLFQIFLGTFGVVCLIGCFQYFYGWPTPQPIPGTNRFHVTVFPGFHLSFASIAIFPFFVALSEIIDQRWLTRRVAIIISVLGLLAIIGTFARQVWISLPVGLFVFILLRLPKRAALVAALLGITSMVGLSQVSTVRDRAMNGMGIQDRFDLWKINTEFFKMRPLTGIGWHHNLPMTGAYYREYRPEITSPFTGHAHSNFFEFLGGLGLIGVAAYFFWTFTTLKQALGIGAGFFAAWIVFHLNGLTQVNLWESKVLHSMMWSMAMILMLRTLKTRESR